MKLSEFTQLLGSNKELPVRFCLPDGTTVPQHAHVTEVGLITKAFIDCGGTRRVEHLCQMQSWVAEDYDHRLFTGKLLGIIEKAAPIIGEEDPPLALEHDLGYATQFLVADAGQRGSEFLVQLAGRHTACLAPEKCCPPNVAGETVVLGRIR